MLQQSTCISTLGIISSGSVRRDKTLPVSSSKWTDFLDLPSPDQPYPWTIVSNTSISDSSVIDQCTHSYLNADSTELSVNDHVSICDGSNVSCLSPNISASTLTVNGLNFDQTIHSNIKKTLPPSPKSDLITIQNFEQLPSKQYSIDNEQRASNTNTQYRRVLQPLVSNPDDFEMPLRKENPSFRSPSSSSLHHCLFKTTLTKHTNLFPLNSSFHNSCSSPTGNKELSSEKLAEVFSFQVSPSCTGYQHINKQPKSLNKLAIASRNTHDVINKTCPCLDKQPQFATAYVGTMPTQKVTLIQ